MTSKNSSINNDSVQKFWEQLSWSGITDYFGNTTTKRGRTYAETGHVKSVWITDDGKNILAVVRGTDEYHTLVTLSENRKKQLALRSECSCPVGTSCKHGVAAIAKYLDMLANNKPVFRCVRKDDTAWEVFSADNTKSTITIEEYDEDDDDDDWEDDDWDDSPRRIAQRTKPAKTAERDALETNLKKKLQTKSVKELADLVLLLFQTSNEVREYFERESFAESVGATNDMTKLVEQAIKLIDKEFKNVSFDYYDRYHMSSSLDLDPVSTIIKQFSKFDDPFPAIERVAQHLLKRSTGYVESSHVEDTCDIDSVFGEMAAVLMKSNIDSVKIILWAYELSKASDYGITDSTKRKILDHAWSRKVWSCVADVMIDDMKKDRSAWSLRTIVQTLDKANRQEEATDLLRMEAPPTNDFRLLVDRLIEYNHLDEAEKIALERRQAEEKKDGYCRDSWRDRLKKIAEVRKDWTTLASIQAAEFFEQPWCANLKVFLHTVKKLKGIEPAIRKSVQDFLQSGEYPAVIKKSFSKEKITLGEQEKWSLPFFSFRAEKKRQEPYFDVLCEWAIDEKRPDDVVQWFDEYQKNRSPQCRGLDYEQVADAICESHPDRAYQIYRRQAEHEMEVSRDYAKAVRTLRKARKTLVLSGRGSEWGKIMEEIRTTHRRKTNLMKELHELDTPSIVQQKRKGR